MKDISMDHSSNTVLDAIDFVPQTLQGAMVYGLSAALHEKITLVDGLITDYPDRALPILAAKGLKPR